MNALRPFSVSNSVVCLSKTVSIFSPINELPHFRCALRKESGFSDEEPLFKLIGTTGVQAGFLKEDGFLNGEKIKKYEGPLLVIHAKEDHIVPFSQGKLLHDNCPSKNKRLISIPNANHNNILSISFKMYFDEIEKFLYSI